MKKYDCVVIGGGAAGLMCAATAGHRGRKVAVLDHANKVGKKILMSGGGRCNFTNYYIEPDNFISDNEHFCKSALSRYTQYDFISLVDKYQLSYFEKTLGQLFCENKAQDILNILLAETDKAGVDVVTQCSVEKIKKSPTTERFRLTTTIGDIECESLVIATGGLSIPTMGATGFGYDIAKQFKHTVKSQQASLVPYTLTGHWLELSKALSGLSLDVTISTNQKQFNEALLFTHRGISGPAVLQITNYWNTSDKIVIDFLPKVDLLEQLKSWKQSGNKSDIKNLISEYVPKRFCQLWLDQIGIKPGIQDASNEDLVAITTLFKRWEVTPSGTEGYRTAEVTRGGVNTDEVSSKTLESKNVKGLYFIGEVLDVTGWLGGFNFQWAWSSGYCAGQYV